MIYRIRDLDAPREIGCERCRTTYMDNPNTFYGPRGLRLCVLCREPARPEHPFPAPPIERGRAVATVNFCEREQCQTMGKSSVMGALTYMLAEGVPTVRKELCPGCVAEFAAWLDDKPLGERPRAYQKPYSPKPAGADLDETGEELMRRAMQKMRLEIEK